MTQSPSSSTPLSSAIMVRSRAAFLLRLPMTERREPVVRPGSDMRAIDTNVIARLIIRSDARQAVSAGIVSFW